MFQRSIDLFKACWHVLRSDKELIWFPVISTIAMIVVTVLFLLPASALLGIFGASAGAEMDSGSPLAMVLFFLWSFVAYSVSLYFNVALIGAALKRLDGGDPTLSDGIAIANARLGKILQYAAISAFISLVLNQIRERGGLLGSLFAGLLEFGWNVITFLVLPVLIVQDVSPIEAIKTSTAMLKKTWGEQLVGNLGMGLVFFVAYLGLFIAAGLLIWLSANVSGVLVVIVVIAAIVAFAAISAIANALGGIYRAMLYRYAETGHVGVGEMDTLLSGAFVSKKK